jgi:hypothetical protein
MKSDLVRGDNLVVFFYPSASYFWPDNLMMDYCIHVSGTYQSEKKWKIYKMTLKMLTQSRWI